MATGLIQQNNITSNTLTAIYSGVPAGKTATVNILVCNAANTTAQITIGLTTGTISTLTANSYIERNALLGAYEVLERGGIVLAAGQYIYLQADGTPAGTTVNLGTTITGYEV
jgi:hypothetical protein